MSGVPGRSASDIRIEPWRSTDISLLTRLLGDPAMMTYLGGAESTEKIAERQQRYLGDPRQFRIVVVDSGEAVGWVGYWDSTWRDEPVLEIGWAVVPEHQGRGIAGRATAQALAIARATGEQRPVHAFPGVDNGPSNGICRKLGFQLLEALDFEYPRGSGQLMRCNDWRLGLAEAIMLAVG
jgi:RimJ/RimL family protein N-acetyltransferase